MKNATSDKHFWHRYTDIYRRSLLRLGPVRNIIEFGVAKGDSIRWLRDEYPSAKINAVDILSCSSDWPQDANIFYHQFDQGDEKALTKFFSEVGGDIDLIIEDGSHIPEHQALCLRQGLSKLRRGGLYILEDIHTSHRSNRAFPKKCLDAANALNLILAIQHLKDAGLPMNDCVLDVLSSEKFFPSDDVIKLFAAIHDIEMYKRSSLPLSCWSCQENEFDYINLRCKCGADLYEEADSMTAVITRA